MNRKIIFLVFIMLFSCKSQKKIKELSNEIEISDLNGKVKKVISNIYYPAQTEPTAFIKKDEIKNIEKKIYNGGGVFSQNNDSIIFFKEPKFEIEYDKKGRTVMSKNTILKDSIIMISKYYEYENNKVFVNHYMNKLGSTTMNSIRSKNDKKVTKSGKAYSIKDKLYNMGKSIYIIDNDKVKKIQYLTVNNDTIYDMIFEYAKNGKVQSIKTDSKDKSLIRETNYVYRVDDKKGLYSTFSIEDSYKSVTKEEIITDKNDLIQKGIVDTYHRAKRIDSKITLEYTYKKKALFQIKKTDSLDALFINETITTYSQDKLIKEIKTNHYSKGKTHFTFEYDFDKKRNWIAKYFLDVNKGGIVKLELRKIEYY